MINSALKYKWILIPYLIVLVSIPTLIFGIKIFLPNYVKLKTYSIINFNPSVKQILQPSDKLTGKGIPQSKVILLLSPGDNKIELNTNNQGQWEYTLPKNIKPGDYRLSVEILDRKEHLASIKVYKVTIVASKNTFQLPKLFAKLTKAQEPEEEEIDIKDLEQHQQFQIWKQEMKKAGYLVRFDEDQDIILEKDSEQFRLCASPLCPLLELKQEYQREIGRRLKNSFETFFGALLEELKYRKIDGYTALQPYFPEIYNNPNYKVIDIFQLGFGVEDEYNQYQKEISEDQLREVIQFILDSGGGRFIPSSAGSELTKFLEERKVSFFLEVAELSGNIRSYQSGVIYDRSTTLKFYFPEIFQKYQNDPNIGKYFIPLRNLENYPAHLRPEIPQNQLLPILIKAAQDGNYIISLRKQEWWINFEKNNPIGNALIQITDPLFSTKSITNIITSTYTDGGDIANAAFGTTILGGPLIKIGSGGSKVIFKAARWSLNRVYRAEQAARDVRVLKEASELPLAAVSERALAKEGGWIAEIPTQSRGYITKMIDGRDIKVVGIPKPPSISLLKVPLNLPEELAGIEWLEQIKWFLNLKKAYSMDSTYTTNLMNYVLDKIEQFAGGRLLKGSEVLNNRQFINSSLAQGWVIVAPEQMAALKGANGLCQGRMVVIRESIAKSPNPENTLVHEFVHLIAEHNRGITPNVGIGFQYNQAQAGQYGKFMSQVYEYSTDLVAEMVLPGQYQSVYRQFYPKLAHSVDSFIYNVTKRSRGAISEADFMEFALTGNDQVLRDKILNYVDMPDFLSLVKQEIDIPKLEELFSKYRAASIIPITAGGSLTLDEYFAHLPENETDSQKPIVYINPLDGDEDITKPEVASPEIVITEAYIENGQIQARFMLINTDGSVDITTSQEFRVEAKIISEPQSEIQTETRHLIEQALAANISEDNYPSTFSDLSGIQCQDSCTFPVIDIPSKPAVLVCIGSKDSDQIYSCDKTNLNMPISTIPDPITISMSEQTINVEEQTDLLDQLDPFTLDLSSLTTNESGQYILPIYVCYTDSSCTNFPLFFEVSPLSSAPDQILTEDKQEAQTDQAAVENDACEDIYYPQEENTSYGCIHKYSADPYPECNYIYDTSVEGSFCGLPDTQSEN